MKNTIKNLINKLNNNYNNLDNIDYREKRLICFSNGQTKSSAEKTSEQKEAPKAKETPRTKSFTEKLNETAKTEFETEYVDNYEKVAENLAKEAGSGITKEDITLRLTEGYKKYQQTNDTFSSYTFDEFWELLNNEKITVNGKEIKCKTVQLKKVDNEWRFMFLGEDKETLSIGTGEGIPIKTTEERIEQARQKGAKEQRTKEPKEQSDKRIDMINGYERARTNINTKIHESMLKLIENEHLWKKAWENPHIVTGMKELKTAISQGFPHLNKTPDLVRTSLLEAIRVGRDKYIDFGDLIEALAKNSRNPLRMPSWGTKTKDLTETNTKKIENSPSLTDKKSIDELTKKYPQNSRMIEKAVGFATAIKNGLRGETKLLSSTNKQTDLVTIVNGHAFHVIILDSTIYLYDFQTKKPTKDNHGYDQSEYFKDSTLINATTDSGQQQKITNWFLNATQPLADRSRILDSYKELFDTNNHTPKNNDRTDIANWYQDVFAGSNRVLNALNSLRFNEQNLKNLEFEESLNISRRTTRRTPLDNLARSITDPETAKVLENGIEFSAHNQNWLKTVENGKFKKALELTEGFIKTLPEGSIYNIVSPTTKEQAKSAESRTIMINLKIPGYRTVKIKIKEGGMVYDTIRIEDTKGRKIDNSWYRPNTFKNGDPKIIKYIINDLNRYGLKETTWEDICTESGVLAEGSPIHTVMGPEIANLSLRKIMEKEGAINGNGEYIEENALKVYERLATKGLANLTKIIYTEDYVGTTEKELKTKQSINLKRFKNNLSGVLFEYKNGLSEIKNLKLTDFDPTTTRGETLIQLIQYGLIDEVKEQEKDHQKELQEQINKIKSDFNQDKEGRAEAIKTIKKHYEDQGENPPADIETIFDEKIFPLMFMAGLDLSTGTVGVGIGTGLEYDLPGDAGTIYFGGGIGAGVDVTGKDKGDITPTVGVGAGYKTPKTDKSWGILSGFSLFGGVSVGAKLPDLSVGAGGAGGVSYDFASIFYPSGRYGIEVHAGLGIWNGIKLPVAALTVAPNHEVNLETMRETALKAYGLDKNSSKITIKDILKSKYLTQIVLQKNLNDIKKIKNYNTKTQEELLESLGIEKVQSTYKQIKEDLEEEIKRNYDPSEASAGFSLGITYNLETNNWGILASKNFVSFDAKMLSLRSDKTQEGMDEEISLSQTMSILNQLRENNGSIKDHNEQIKLATAGNILRDADGDLRVRVDRSSEIVTTTSETKEVNDINSLGEKLNEMYKPLGLRVEFDEREKMFKLIIADADNNTNYEIAMSNNLQEEGIIKKGDQIYINSSFKPNNTFTIRRSDYLYPFPKEGKSQATLITISADPHEAPNVIYGNSASILQARGVQANGLPRWRELNGPNKHGTNILAPQGRKRLNDQMFAQETEGFEIDTKKEKELFGEGSEYNKTVLEGEEIIDNEKFKALHNFSIDLLGENGNKAPFAQEYRKLSTNKGVLTEDNKDLISAVQRKWEEKNPKTTLSTTELQVVLNNLANLSFSEIKGNNLDAINQRFNNVEKILTAQLQKKITEYNKKNPKNQITKSAKELAQFAIGRARKIVLDNKESMINVNTVDRYSSIAGTLGIQGFRESGETKNIPNNAMYMLRTMEIDDQIKFPIPNDPVELKELTLLAIESLSPLTNLSGSVDTNKFEEFKKTPIVMQLFALMKDKESAKMFANPEHRYLVAEMLSGKVTMFGIQLLENSKKYTQALSAFNKIAQQIRQAQLEGKKEIESPFNKDFIFEIGFEVKDGVYDKCKNYTMWVNEKLSAHINKDHESRRNFAGYAGYGNSRAHAETAGYSQASTVYKVGVGVAVGPSAGGKGDEPPEAGPGKKTGGEAAGKPNTGGDQNVDHINNNNMSDAGQV